MEIEHIVKTSDAECNELFMIAVKVASASFPTVEEQNAAILAVVPEFKAKLDSIAAIAYGLGKKMKKANKLDTVMYAEVV